MVYTHAEMDQDPKNQRSRDEELVEELSLRMRQRRAEIAAEDASDMGPGLADLESTQHVEEPIPFSARAGLASAIVFLRKSFYSFFLKWYSQPVLRQQNSFNRAASLRIQELVKAQRELEREVAALRKALEGSDDS